MKAIRIIAGVICVASVGAFGFFGYNAFNSWQQTKMTEKSLASLNQSIDICKSQINDAKANQSTYYDTYLEVTAVAGIEITKIYAGSKDQVVEDASTLSNYAPGTEIGIKCKVVNKAALIDIMKISHVEKITQTDKGMEVIIKL